MTTSDVELMLAFQQGDVGAFTKLVGRHQAPLLNFFFRLTWDRHQAEDLTQEVFCKLYRAAKGYAPRAKFTTYLYRIARNHWIDFHRSPRGARNAHRSLDAMGKSDHDSATSFADQVPGRERSPHQELEGQEIFSQVQDALDELSDDQRMVFVLGEIQGMKYARISEVLDIPVGTVKSRMHTAVMRLRKTLAPFMEPDR